MKIRIGFVSNSSSSSFIVAFAKTPEDIQELNSMLFDNSQKEFPCDIDGDYFPNRYPVYSVAETVFESMKEPISDEEAIEICRSGWIDGMPSLDTSNKDFNATHRAWMAKLDEFARKAFDKFRKQNKKASLFVFEYSDNEGEYESTLEHGDLFRKLPHLTVSHH